MKEKFIDYKPHKKTAQIIEWVNGIIYEYQVQGYILTLRQLFYQLVSRTLIANTKKSYDSLSKILTNARMAGLVDWDSIEDRGRVPRIPACTNSIHMMHFYRLLKILELIGKVGRIIMLKYGVKKTRYRGSWNALLIITISIW